MFRLVLRALVLGAIALGVWQLAATGIAVQAHHEGNTYNCDDFDSQDEAQEHFDDHTDDQDNLDTDGDDIACEQYDYGDDEDEDHFDSDYNHCVPFHGSHQQANPYPYLYPYPQLQTGCDPYLYPNYPTIIPAPSRTSHISMVIADTSIECNAETALVARLVYPSGIGASAHMVQFQSTLGTVFSNVLTDPGGYAQTRFVAPSIPAQVQITAFGDGLTQTQTVNVTCAVPTYPTHPPAGQQNAPIFKPPSTGEAGLVSAAGSASLWLLLSAFVLTLSAPAAAVAVVKSRR